MNEGRVDFLDSVNAVGGDNETVVGQFGKSATVFAGPCDREHLSIAGFFERINEVWRFAAGADHQRHVAGLGLYPQLVDVNARVIDVVSDRGQGGDIGHQWDNRKRGALFDDRMRELDTEMQCITKTAAVAHHEEPFALRKASRHVAGHLFDLRRVLAEKLLLHLNAFVALAQNFLGEGFRRLHKQFRT